jgi:tetratricopeptide (TPR) repeat protein
VAKERRIIMIKGKSQRTVGLLRRSLGFLVVIALAGTFPPTSWSQSHTFKAPIPKPSPRTPAQAPEKNAPVSPVEPAINYEQEMKKVNSLIDASDRNADAFYNRGWLYEHQGNLEMAEKDYTKAIVLNRHHKEAYYNRGLIYVKKGNFDGAIMDFSEVLRLDPRSADAYCNRGNAYLQIRKSDQSIRDYDAALRIRPNDPDILCNRGIAYLEMGNTPKAVDDFRKAAAAGHAKAQERLRSIDRQS